MKGKFDVYKLTILFSYWTCYLVINISFNFVFIQNILGVWLFYCITHSKAICKGQVTVGALSKKWTRTPIIMSRKSNYFASLQLIISKWMNYSNSVPSNSYDDILPGHSKMPPAKNGCLLSFVKYIKNKTQTEDVSIKSSTWIERLWIRFLLCW